jgi:hypothetical protein
MKLNVFITRYQVLDPDVDKEYGLRCGEAALAERHCGPLSGMNPYRRYMMYS